MVPYSEYNNDASAVDFTLDNDAVAITPEGYLELRLTKDNGGPRVSTTRPVHYGRMTARMKTSKWQGVVTAFVSGSPAARGWRRVALLTRFADADHDERDEGRD